MTLSISLTPWMPVGCAHIVIKVLMMCFCTKATVSNVFSRVLFELEPTIGLDYTSIKLTPWTLIRCAHIVIKVLTTCFLEYYFELEPTRQSCSLILLDRRWRWSPYLRTDGYESFPSNILVLPSSDWNALLKKTWIPGNSPGVRNVRSVLTL